MNLRGLSGRFIKHGNALLLTLFLQILNFYLLRGLDLIYIYNYQLSDALLNIQIQIYFAIFWQPFIFQLAFWQYFSCNESCWFLCTQLFVYYIIQSSRYCLHFLWLSVSNSSNNRCNCRHSNKQIVKLSIDHS